jgi:integrase
MGFQDVDRAIERANAKKEIVGLPIRIVRQRAKLYLRGTFPSKTDGQPSQCRYPLYLDASVHLISIAVTKAREIGLKLALGEFKWEIEQPIAVAPPVPQIVTIGQWVAEFERQYWTKKERTKDAELNYRTDYGAIFEKIDLDKAISIDRLKSSIANNSKPDTRTRVRWCNALGKLAECAELNRQPIRELRGNYSMSEPLEQRDIPELDRVVECFDLLKAKDPIWARAFGMYATYGIRPGELWTLDTSRLNDNNYHELVVRANKTNRTRVTYPYPVEWFDRFELSQFTVPTNTSSTARGQGYIPTRQFKRLGLEIECYTLRHFHAIQLILGGIDSATAAKWMGHSQLMFDRVYLHWMDERHHRKLFDRLVDK